MKIHPISIVATSALFLIACGGGGGSNGGDGMGSLSLGVTDAPVDDADAVRVTFEGVELINGGDRQSFSFDPVQVNLLEQQGEQQFFLIQGQSVPAGVYDRVRLIVSQENRSASNQNCMAAMGDPEYPNHVQIGDEISPLLVPSGATSGFQINGPITVAAGGSAAYTVDFDLRKSLAQRGNTGCFNLRPVLRVIDNAQVGVLTGQVDSALFVTPKDPETQTCATDAEPGNGTAVYVFQNVDGLPVEPDDFDGSGIEPLTTAMLTRNTNAETEAVSYEYSVGFLLAGDYTVAFSCNANEDLPPDTGGPGGDDNISFVGTTTVTIEPDAVTVQDFEAAAPAVTE